MYIYVYIYIFIYTYTYMYIYIYTHIHIYPGGTPALRGRRGSLLPSPAFELRVYNLGFKFKGQGFGV